MKKGKDQLETVDELSVYWSMELARVADILGCHTSGLSHEQAAIGLKKYGLNTLKTSGSLSGLMLFVSQFKSPITLLLMIAAVLSAGLGDLADTIIILSIVFISSVLGFIQEVGASNAVAELLKVVQLNCHSLREGMETIIPVEQLVPGDLVLLSAGDIIPGDGLLVSADSLFIDEAAFTGESYPVEKSVGVVAADAGISARTNTVFMGSSVISGKARVFIVKTGKETEFGRISDYLRTRIPETSFEEGIRKFGYLLMEITLLLVIIIFAINVILHKPVLDSFLFSLALAVGLTPQLLPAIISVNLSAGAKRMAAKKVIVKRLSAIENIGSMDVLCSDKTGTITQGKVVVKGCLDPLGNSSGRVMQLAWLNSSLQRGFSNPIDRAITAAYTPDPGSAPVRLNAEIPYDFIRKRLSVQVTSGSSSFAITKGALKVILSLCSKVELSGQIIQPVSQQHSAIMDHYHQLSEQGLRTLGIAYKPMSGGVVFTREDEQDMIFLGFITLLDPPKQGIGLTITKLADLGVKLKIITGDNLLVAKRLAMDIGIKAKTTLTGEEMQHMSSSALSQKLSSVQLFAEIEPSQKERIILLLKKTGHVVGFLGDGINDAPALHAADVGISVDTAVDVAKEAADIVLLQSDLEVICEGVKEGRKTFLNTMKYIFMATSANFGNMFSMAGASLFLNFLPLLPKQILLTNLLTDFPEMAISTDRVDEETIRHPQRWDLAFITRFMLLFGLLSSVFDFITFGILIFVLHADTLTFRSAWFTESVISAILIVLIVRTRLPIRKSFPGKYLALITLLVLTIVLVLPFTPLAVWFGFGRLNVLYYIWILLIVSAYIASAELLKIIFYKTLRTKKTPPRVRLKKFNSI